MGRLHHQTLIFICGWPFSGKTSLAERVRDELNVHHVDIDDMRWLAIGKPYPHPNESPELMKKDGQEMGGAYRLVFTTIDWHLETGRSILATATLSSKPHGQEKLRAVYEKYPLARVKIIQCVPQGDTSEVVARLMGKRDFGESGYRGAVNSPERYYEVKGRFNPIELPHLEILTWGSDNEIKDEVKLAMGYILLSKS
ncbi:MAG: zeta toxin family protein [Patescibacteria group bacterium]